MTKVEEYKKSKRKAREVRVEKAHGGFITHTLYAGPQDTSNAKYPMDNGPEKQVHKTMSSVHAHMKDCMGE